jgi:rhodanese-related sulfurtransferase
MVATGLIAGTLGVVGCDQGSRASAEAFTQVARAIVRKEDRVTGDELAHWIIEDRKDFVLIDIRPKEDFDAGHIDTARHVPLIDLVKDETLESLPADRRIVLYSNGTENAAQAVVMLRLAGRNAYSLLGGSNLWNRHILDPDLVANTDEEVLEVRERQAIACYFAGNYKTGADLPSGAEQPMTSAPFMPPVQPVVTDRRAGVTEHVEKEEEGC